MALMAANGFSCAIGTRHVDTDIAYVPTSKHHAVRTGPIKLATVCIKHWYIYFGIRRFGLSFYPYIIPQRLQLIPNQRI